MVEEITCCRVCGNSDIKEFLDLGMQPPANSLIKDLEKKEDFFPLSLSWCPRCNLIQLNHTIEPKKLFSNYVWVTGTSETAKKYSQQFYEKATSRLKNIDGYILEIASNDGTFLKPFVNNGFKVLGVDPAKNIVQMAVKDNVPTICRFFGVETANEITEKEGKAKIVFARNVVPHVANLHDFIKGLEICLDDDGLLILEIHYAKIILNELHYDSIYHEHLCYFTIKSIEQLLNNYNLFIKDIEKSPISGGSMVLYISKNKNNEKPIVQEYRDFEKSERINEFASWQEFAKKTKVHKKKLLEILTDAKNKGKQIVGYGASARSSTMLNYCNIGSELIKVIADRNPLKQGLHTAGTHILIQDPTNVMKTKPDLVFILAWNFKKEIINYLKQEFNYDGMFLIPLPNNPQIKKGAANDDF